MAFRKAPAPIARALAERDYKDATPVQTAMLEEEAEGRDLLVSAQTGSGKTVAYGLALAETLLDGAESLGPAGARVTACVGGMDPGAERRALSAGVHIVVGTPGRLRDHLERRALKVAGLRAVVLDEADEMLDLGFREDLQFILKTTPAERRTLLFSATLPKSIVTLAQHYQKDALRVAMQADTSGHADIEYRAIRTPHNGVERAMVNLLRFMDPPGALVFCNTRQSVRHLEAMLLERGFAAVSLSGELSQSERNHALQALRDGRAKVCVATDVAARGIDLPNLALVVHADLPSDAQVLQHRSGRTGRAGRKGVSILLVPQARRRKAEEMLAKASANFTWSEPPSAADIRRLDTERLLQNPVLTEQADADDLTMANTLLAAHGPQQIAAAFVKLYRAQLPAPEDISESPPYAQKEKGPRDHTRPSSPRGEKHPRSEHRDRGPRQDAATLSVQANRPWFLLNVGRERNADPKWLLPEICRQGDVTKADIGAIRVYDTETRFQIDAKVAEKFAALVAGRQKGGVRIFPAPGNHGDQSPPRHKKPEPTVHANKPAQTPHAPREKPRWKGNKGKKNFGRPKPG